MYFKLRYYLPIHPPSTVSMVPCMYAAAAEHRNKVAPLMSSGCPQRPAGILSKTALLRKGSLSKAMVLSVAI